MFLCKCLLARHNDVKKLSVVTLSPVFLYDSIKDKVTYSPSPRSLSSLPTYGKARSTKEVVVSHTIQNLIPSFANFCGIYCMNGHLKRRIFTTKICLLLCNTTVNYQVSARIINLALHGKSCSSIVTFAPGKYDFWQLSMTESHNSLIAANLSACRRRLREFLSSKRM